MNFENGVYSITSNGGFTLYHDGGNFPLYSKEPPLKFEGWYFERIAEYTYLISPYEGSSLYLTPIRPRRNRPGVTLTHRRGEDQHWQIDGLGMTRLLVRINENNLNKLVIDEKGSRSIDRMGNPIKTYRPLMTINHKDKDEHSVDQWNIQQVKNPNPVRISHHSGQEPIVHILGIEGCVFTKDPYPYLKENDSKKEVHRLWELANPETNESFLTADRWTKKDSVKNGWQVVAKEMWVYKSGTQKGMVPLHRFYDRKNEDFLYTTNAIEVNELKSQAERYKDKGVVCSLLPLAVATSKALNKKSVEGKGSEIAPLLRVHHVQEKITRYHVEPSMIKETLQLGKRKIPTISQINVKADALLDEHFGKNFGPIGQRIGEILKVFDIRFSLKPEITKETAEPYWSTMLQDRGLASKEDLESFQLVTRVMTWKGSMKNIANPDRGRLKAEFSFKAFMSDEGPEFQFWIKFPGEYCLDDIVPKEARYYQSIPVIGPFLVKDITLVASTYNNIYDPGLDAGIVAGLNFFANIEFITSKDNPRQRPKIMSSVSQMLNIKSAALHLGIGVSLQKLKVGFIAEMALQYQRYSIGAELSQLNNKFGISDGSGPLSRLGNEMAFLENNYFSARYTRSDFIVEGELGLKDLTFKAGMTSDLAVEIKNLGEYGLQDSKFVLTGGGEYGVEIDLNDEDGNPNPTFLVDLLYTMNGTGRNMIGKLTGEKLTGDEAAFNTTELKLGTTETNFLTIKQAAFEAEVGIKPIEEPPFVEPKLNSIGFTFKGGILDIEGEVAFKINIGSPEDMKAFVFICSWKELTILDFLAICGGLRAIVLDAAYKIFMPDKWKKKIDKIFDMSIQDAVFFFVPVPNSIAGVFYKQTGYVVGGRLNLYGWHMQFFGVYDHKTGVAIEGQMDEIDVSIKGHQILKLSRSTKTKLPEKGTFREKALKGTKTELSGPMMHCQLIKPNFIRNVSHEYEIKLKIDTYLNFLGAELDVFLELDTGKRIFVLDTAFNAGLVSGNLHLEYHGNKSSFSRHSFLFKASGGFTVPKLHLSLNTLLGHVHFGKLSLDNSFKAEIEQYHYSFVLRMELSFNGRTWWHTHHLEPHEQWSDLKKIIEGLIRKYSERIVSYLLDNVHNWAQAAKHEIVEVTSTSKKMLMEHYQVEEREISHAFEKVGMDTRIVHAYFGGAKWVTRKFTDTIEDIFD